jgi:1,4-dihydroxy-2-naphthoate octaprenyltransferase
MGERDWRALAQTTHPMLLLLGALLFALGTAMVRYLGGLIPVGTYLLGQAAVTSLQLAAHSLDVFYAQSGDRMRPERVLSIGSPEQEPTGIRLRWLLYGGIACLTIAGSVAAVLLARGNLSLAASVILLSLALAAVFFGMPPVRLSESGYGELAAAFFMGAGIPAFAFTLLTGDLHRLLLLSTPPLVAALFGSIIALALPTFGRRGPEGRRNLATRLNWPLAMRLHDISLLVAFLLLAIAITAGLPWRVGYGAMLALPLALAQIWTISRIRAGAKPNWPLLTYLMLAGYLLS